MAAFDTTRPAAAMPAGIFTFVSNMFGTIAAWNDARVTRKSLSALSARELDDIGLSYADIDSVSTRATR